MKTNCLETNDLIDLIVDILIGWIQEQPLHHSLCQLQVTSLQETWVCQCRPVSNVAEGVITAHTFGERGHVLNPAHSQRCSPHTRIHVQEHQQGHHRPPGGNCQVQACHGDTSHP